MRHHLAYVVGLVATVASVTPAAAQSDADAPWLAWYGCWSVSTTGVADVATRPVTCVLPTADGNPASVERLVLLDNAVVERGTLVADGSRRVVDDANCTGWESARFAEDGARVYFDGELQCGNLPAQRTSGVLSLTAWSEWLRVDVVLTGEQERLAVQRATALPWAVLPASVQEELQPLQRAAEAARAAASLDLQAALIADVGAATHPAVTTAWLVETAQSGRERFRLARRDLVSLDQSGLQDRVIDAAVAAAHPEQFLVAVRPQDGRIRTVAENGPAGISASQSYGGSGCSAGPGGLPWQLNETNALPSYHRAALFFPDCLPMQFFGWYGLGPFGQVGQWPGFFPNNGGYPVTVVVTPIGSSSGSTGDAAPRGRVVNGSGYSAPASRGPATASSSSGGRSSGSSAQGAGSSSSGGERTAKRRNP